MNVETFFSKNLKYIAFIFFALFIIKSAQSCNRDMATKRIVKENAYVVDSLNAIIDTDKGTYIMQLKDCNDNVQELQYEVKLANSERDAANRRADAVQSTAEKIRENTSITIENKSKTDTVSVDKK
jgi:hypothetical protein